jgi:hypothetical protein
MLELLELVEWANDMQWVKLHAARTDINRAVRVDSANAALETSQIRLGGSDKLRYSTLEQHLETPQTLIKQLEEIEI